MKPGVTLSMIVRDDAAKLRRCLESAADFVDAILIVDTGSTDGTIGVAEEFGAEVHTIEWPDAFDLARNFGFERVRTQWTLWLDADEWLLPQSGQMIRHAIRQWEASAYFITRIDEQTDGTSVKVELVRLWRTHPAMRVFGTVHENFSPIAFQQAADGRPVLRSPITIGHDGYDQGNRDEKLRRNARLLRKHVEEREPSFYHEAHLYFALMHLGEPEGGNGFRNLARRIVEQWPHHAMETMAPVVLGSVLADMSDEEVRTEFAGRCIALIEEAFPYSPTALWECHRAHSRRGETERSTVILIELQRRGRTGDFERINPMHPRLFEAVENELAAVRNGHKEPN